MKSVLILGAGRSSSSLINYLTGHALENDWRIVIGDLSLQAAREKAGNSSHAAAIQFDIRNPESAEIIRHHDVVISLLPPAFHAEVAKACLQFEKHMLTASYLSDEMRSMDSEAHQKDLLFLNECGLDPGIDHMSAMKMIDRIRRDGGEITSFESFTGGLIAPETDPENPWRYKFTWNPGNVVMAGQSGARFLENEDLRYISYPQLFRRITPVSVAGLGEFEGYANRDSLSYRDAYGLQGAKTMLRGTLRYKGFCSAWDIFVQLGCTDNSYEMENVDQMTHHDYLNSFLDFHPERSVEEKLSKAFHLKPDGPEIQKLNWSGFFDNSPVGLTRGTPAKILEHILNKNWKLNPHDRDMIVMWHRIRFTAHHEEREIQATLIAMGENATQTAMAKTVGLPLGIAAKLLLKGSITRRGVVIPTLPELYEPILEELSTLGIVMNER